MGSRNWAKPSAASSSHSYFSTNTFFRGHGFSLEMRRGSHCAHYRTGRDITQEMYHAWHVQQRLL
jgi:hypothetical protein